MRTALALALACCGLLYMPAAAQMQIEPDCVIIFTFTAAGQQTDPTVDQGHNNTTGCIDWQLVYFSTGFSALSLVVQSSADLNGGPAGFVTFAGTVVSGVNPNTSTSAANTHLFGFYPWNRVRLASVTGSGSVTGQLYGCRQPGCSASGGTSSGGSGTVTSVGTGCGLTGGPITTAGTIKLFLPPELLTSTSHPITDGECGMLLLQSNAMASAFTIPQAGAGGMFVNGWFTELQNRGVGTLTLTAAAGSLLFDCSGAGASTLVLTTGQGVFLHSNGMDYYTECGKAPPGATGATGPTGSTGATGATGATGGGGGVSLNSLGMFGPTVDPTTFTYAFINQNGSVVTTGTSALSFFSPTSGATAVQLYTTAVTGSSPYTATLTFWLSYGTATNSVAGGMCISDGTKVLAFVLEITGPAWEVLAFSNPTTFNSFITTGGLRGQYSGLTNFRIREDMTTRHYAFSFDGVNYIDVFTEPAGTFLTATSVGPCADTQTGAAWVNVDSLVITAP